ncbi:jg27872 [Pararge aegeria aegeria]|uniref:Jg27872 protein n=1 Tax=Pararge aegeria aegeria TaxID=348720 RepID=A0A8S4RZF4_9NEOP|nr:jg27872 [Pararge aegeria aegeria]
MDATVTDLYIGDKAKEEGKYPAECEERACNVFTDDRSMLLIDFCQAKPKKSHPTCGLSGIQICVLRATNENTVTVQSPHFHCPRMSYEATKGRQRRTGTSVLFATTMITNPSAQHGDYGQTLREKERPIVQLWTVIGY